MFHRYLRTLFSRCIQSVKKSASPRENYKVILLVGDLEHLIAGFPSNPMGHVHMGLCILAWQRAPSAQALVNSQGSWQRDM